MKRKLSLLMVLMMVLTLIPAMPSFAATANRVDRIVSVTSNGNTSTNSPNLIIDADGKGDLKPGQTFRLELSEFAEWTDPVGTPTTIDSGAYANASVTGTVPATALADLTGITVAMVNGVPITLTQDFTLLSVTDVATEIVALVDALPNVSASLGALGKYTITSDNTDPIVITTATADFGIDNGTYTIPAGVGRITLNQVSKRRVEVTVVNAGPNAKFAIPLDVEFNGAPEGPQQVTVVALNSGVTPNSYTFATIGQGTVTLKADSKVKISRSGNQTVNLTLDEIAIDSFETNGVYTLRLPKNFYWASESITGGPASVSVAGTDNRELTVTVTNANSTTRLESIFIKADVVPTRDAKFGDVEVSVTKGKLSPSSLVVAEYVDFAGMVSVKEVVKAISGRNEVGLYKATVIIEEPVAATLIGNRFIEFTMKSNVASLQNGTDVSVQTKKGAGLLEIDRDSSRAFPATGLSPIAGVVTSDTIESHKFDLKVSTATAPNAAAGKYELEIPFVVDSRYEGDVELTVKGAGIPEQTVVIATAKKPVKVEVVGNNLAELKLGVQSQKAPELIVTEVEAGALVEGMYSITTNSQYQINWADAKFEVLDGGDIEINEDSFGVRGKALQTGTRDGIDIEVDGASTKASKIRIYDIKITLDRSVPYGEFNADFNFGELNRTGFGPARPNSQYKDLVNRTERVPYFKVVTPVQDAQRLTAVFKIGEASYTVNGEAKTLDAPVFVSNNRTMLPIGAIAQVVGASVNYSAETRTAVFVKDGIVVSMTLDQPFLVANGVMIPMDSAPEVVQSRAFVPMAFVAQAFGVPVQYNAETKEVTVN